MENIYRGIANFVVETDSIEELSNRALDQLQCGDKVIKVTGNQKHAYVVTYKGEGAGEGICLSYFAYGYLETIAYDRKEDGTWEFNSKDVWQAQD